MSDLAVELLNPYCRLRCCGFILFQVAKLYAWNMLHSASACHSDAYVDLHFGRPSTKWGTNRWTNDVSPFPLFPFSPFLEHFSEYSFSYLLFSKQLYCLSSNLNLVMGISYKGVRVIVGVLIAFDYLAVGLRLWARNIKCKPLEINDYLIIVGLVWIRILTAVKASTSIDIG